MNPAVALGCVLLAFAQGQPDGGKLPTPAPRPEVQPDQLRERLDSDNKRLASLLKSVEGARAEHARTLALLRKLEESEASKASALECHRAEGDEEQAARLERELASLRQAVSAARKRLDLMSKERNALQEIANSLKDRISRTQDLLGAQKPGEPSAARAEAPPSRPAGEAEKKPAAPPSDKDGRRLTEAREEARKKEEEARKAQAEVRSFAEVVESLQREIEAERKLLATAREKSVLARQRKDELDAQYAARRKEGADEAELALVTKRAQLQETRLNEAAEEEKQAQDQLTQLQTDLGLLQARQIVALQQAEKKRAEARQAEKEVATLENPFSWLNVMTWLVKRGPRVAMFVLVTFLLQRLVSRMSQRIARTVARRESNRRDDTEESRAVTLAGVFHHSFSALVCGVGGLMVLDEAGIPVATLLGGAAVVGLAVSFGAQNLIKDYFAGFMILLEDQYGVGDWVRINGLEGEVERVTLRVTSLRDLGGKIHFVPHGSITSVTNMTHTWSRAKFEIPVAYREDTDRVIAVLLQLCREIQQDPKFGSQLLGQAEMLGIDSFNDSAVVLKFLLKTRASKQWAVQSEMLRRIKQRFEELNIEVPASRRATASPAAPPASRAA